MNKDPKSKTMHLRKKTQVRGSYDAISLSRPLSENKPFRTLSSDDWPKDSKHQKRQGGGQRVDHQALYAGNSGYFRIGEQNARSKGYSRGKQLAISMLEIVECRRGGEAAARSPRKH